MSDFFPIYVYSGLVFLVTLVVLGLSALHASKRTAPAKFLPYESGIQTETHLLQERCPLRHYLVALIFLLFDIEVIFLYPWAVSAYADSGGVPAGLVNPVFGLMLVFMATLGIAYFYAWKKGVFQWR